MATTANFDTSTPSATPSAPRDIVGTPLAPPAPSVLQRFLGLGIVQIVVALLTARFEATGHTQAGDITSHDANVRTPDGKMVPRLTADGKPDPYPSIAQILVDMGIATSIDEAVSAVFAAIWGSEGKLGFGREKGTLKELGLREITLPSGRVRRTVGVWMSGLVAPREVVHASPELLAAIRAKLTPGS